MVLGLPSIPKKWLVILLALAVLSPLGILIVGINSGAWGEWDSVGNWTPWKIWHAPFNGYDFAGWNNNLTASIGYIFSAFVGVAAIILVVYVLGRVMNRKNTEGKDNK